MPLPYPEGTTALATDSEQRALHKILEAINDGAGAGGGGLSGSGSPEGVVTANPGTTYDDATNNVFYVKDTGTGNTGWRELIA